MLLGLILLIFAGPRIATIVWWLFNPAYFRLTFSTIFWPILGVIFVPFATLMYLIVAPGGIVGWDWFWIGLALVGDIFAYTGTYSQRNKLTA